MPIHIRAQSADVAPIVFLPGDPDRATWIAENFFENPRLYTKYRHMFGYTGTYKGERFSVQSTGMGGPSAAIVCEELVQLGAKVFIRIGTCGAMDPNLEPAQTILVSAACPFDGTSNEIFGKHGFAPHSDFHFLKEAWDFAQTNKYPAHVSSIASLDKFYGHAPEFYQKLASYGISAVEMEASTILTIAAKYGLKSAALLTVSDILDGQKRASDERILEGVKRMMEIALNAAIRCYCHKS